jgi:hypothetical protein
MKIAALIIAHKSPENLSRLLRRLSGNSWSRYLHIDRKSELSQFTDIADIDVHVLKKRYDVHWGGYSQILATLELLQCAFADRTNTHFYLMSGQCFPIKSDLEIADVVEACEPNANFFNSVAMPQPTKPLSRLSHWHFPSLTRPQVRRFAERAMKLFPRRDVKKLLRGLEPRAGAQWWLLNRESAAKILDFIKENSWYIRAFKYSHCSDEMFFQTLLHHLDQHPGRGCPTVMRWVEGKASPENVTASLHAEFSQGWHLFARKFDRYYGP